MSFLQGFGATSQETGTTILPGLSGANPHRPACPESCLSNAGVHTVWVGMHKDALIHTPLINTSCLDFRGELYLVRSFRFNLSLIFPPVECVHLVYHCSSLDGMKTTPTYSSPTPLYVILLSFIFVKNKNSSSII